MKIYNSVWDKLMWRACALDLDLPVSFWVKVEAIQDRREWPNLTDVREVEALIRAYS